MYVSPTKLVSSGEDWTVLHLPIIPTWPNVHLEQNLSLVYCGQLSITYSLTKKSRKLKNKVHFYYLILTRRCLKSSEALDLGIGQANKFCVSKFQHNSLKKTNGAGSFGTVNFWKKSSSGKYYGMLQIQIRFLEFTIQGLIYNHIWFKTAHRKCS